MPPLPCPGPGAVSGIWHYQTVNYSTESVNGRQETHDDDHAEHDSGADKADGDTDLEALQIAVVVGYRTTADPGGAPSTTAPNVACTGAGCRGRLVAAGLPGLYECGECGRVHHQIAGEIEDAESATDERSAVGAWGGRR